MDYSGSLRALEQVWLNQGGVATIIPLKHFLVFSSYVPIFPAVKGEAEGGR